MEIRAEKTKQIANSANSIQREIKVKRTESWNSDKLQAPGSNPFRCRLKTGGSLKDCTSHCSSDKAEANME